MIKILIFLTILNLIQKSHQKELKIFIYDPTISSSENFINDTSATVKCKINTKENPCEWTPKVTFNVVKEIQKPYLQLKLVDLSTSATIVDQTLMACGLTSTLGLDIVMKVIWEQISKYMDVMVRCPILKEKVTVISFDQSAMKLIFNMFPKNRPYLFSIILKVRNGKKIEEILNYSEKVEVVEV